MFKRIVIGCCTRSIRASRCIGSSGGMPRIITSSRLRRYSKIGVRGDPLPRPNDSTGYGYDSLAEGSEIKIYHYSTSTGNLTALVAEDDNFPPQLGIHYWVGFENSLYIDEFEGIVPSYRGRSNGRATTSTIGMRRMANSGLHGSTPVA